MDGLCLLHPWALGPSLAPAPYWGCQEVMIQAELGGGADTQHSLCQCLFTQKTRSEPGILSPSRNAKPGQWGLCSPQPGGQAEQSPSGRGHPWGPYGAVAVTILPPGTMSTWVCKRRGEPRGQLGLGAGWSLQGANGSFPERCWAGVPGTHPACRRAVWWEDLMSV